MDLLGRPSATKVNTSTSLGVSPPAVDGSGVALAVANYGGRACPFDFAQGRLCTHNSKEAEFYLNP